MAEFVGLVNYEAVSRTSTSSGKNIFIFPLFVLSFLSPFLMKSCLKVSPYNVADDLMFQQSCYTKVGLRASKTGQDILKSSLFG